MPPTQRKIIGPESSTPWRLYVNRSSLSSVKVLKEKTKNKPTNSDQEVDDTKVGVYLKIGVLTHVKGSAYIEVGQTKIIAAVHPPRECSKQNKRTTLGIINCELKYDRCASASLNKAAIVRNEKYYSLLLKKALEPAVCRQEFPNFQIDIIVHVLDDSGSVLSSAINCAGAALVDGGVPMFDIIVASTVFIEKGELLLKPTIGDLERVETTEETDTVEEYGTVVLAQLPTCNQICQCFQKGYMSLDLFKEAQKSLGVQNQNISKLIRQVIVRKVKKSLDKEKDS